MAIKAIDLRRGMAINYRDGLWVVVDNEKVAKGNWRSYMQITIKNFRTGQQLRERFRVDENLDQAMLDRKVMEYLYSDQTNLVVMDPTSYEQVEIPAELVGEDKVYLLPNMPLTISSVDGQAVGVELPFTVELKVADTPPEVKGATATNVLKEALCEGGAKVKVPAFINIGDSIKVDTRTGEYLSRA